jgi:hypothetical protein
MTRSGDLQTVGWEFESPVGSGFETEASGGGSPRWRSRGRPRSHRAPCCALPNSTWSAAASDCAGSWPWGMCGRNAPGVENPACSPRRRRAHCQVRIRQTRAAGFSQGKCEGPQVCGRAGLGEANQGVQTRPAVPRSRGCHDHHLAELAHAADGLVRQMATCRIVEIGLYASLGRSLTLTHRGGAIGTSGMRFTTAATVLSKPMTCSCGY